MIATQIATVTKDVSSTCGRLVSSSVLASAMSSSALTSSSSSPSAPPSCSQKPPASEGAAAADVLRVARPDRRRRDDCRGLGRAPHLDGVSSSSSSSAERSLKSSSVPQGSSALASAPSEQIECSVQDTLIAAGC